VDLSEQVISVLLEFLFSSFELILDILLEVFKFDGLDAIMASWTNFICGVVKGSWTLEVFVCSFWSEIYCCLHLHYLGILFFYRQAEPLDPFFLLLGAFELFVAI